MSSPPVVPNRTYPLYTSDPITSLPVTFTATCVDATDQANTHVYAAITTRNNKIITIKDMTRSGSNYSTSVRAPGTSHKINFKPVSGVPTSGYWVARLFGAQSNPIPWNASASDIAATIEALPDLNEGDTLVSGRMVDPGGVTITLRGNRVGVGYLMDYNVGWWATSRLKVGSTSVDIVHTIVTQGTGDIPDVGNGGHGDWYWFAFSYRAGGDGRYSGGATNPRQADRTDPWPWWYSNAAGLTLTRPDGSDPTFAGRAPLIQWAINQTNSSRIVYQEVNIVDVDLGKSVWFWATAPTRPDGTSTGTDRKLCDFSGDLDDREYRTPYVLHHLHNYRCGVRIFNDAGQVSFVDHTFSIVFTAASPVSSLTAFATNTGSYIDFSWPAYTVSGFDGYEIRYRHASDAWGDASDTTVWSSGSTADDMALTSVRVMEFPLGVPIVFGHFVRTIAAGENLISNPREWTPPSGTLGLYGVTVISETVSPRRYVVFPYRQPRAIAVNFDIDDRVPWGQELPIVQRSDTFFQGITCTYPLLYGNDPNVAAINDLDTVATYKQMSKSLQLKLYRDGRGNMIYGHIKPWNTNEPEDQRITEISLDFIETSGAAS
ncbi:MAG TPA: hypothetical protein VFQ54_01775 [Thermomicrobiales bacterium]|nr:hypothetical protein [Thermomicrobiales bacterium]